MPNIKPFRDYDEHEVINLFAHSGALPATKGTFVKVGQGWTTATQDLQFLGPVGASYPNTVSERFGVFPRVLTCASGEAPLGMLLRDVREVDENGIPLKFNPTKATQMGCVVSGQAVPILKRGLVLWSGLASLSEIVQVSAGTALYTWTNGGLSVTGAASHKVGVALGAPDAQGYFLLNLSL